MATEKDIKPDSSPFRGRGGLIPGEYILKPEPIECNVGRPTVAITVVNTGDRPVQVGSHYHFFESNKQLEFDRAKAFGMRLNIAAGTAVRFEPGEEKEVVLTTFGGNRTIHGFNNLVNGETISANAKQKAMEKALAQGFKNKTT
jgi:urease beta subunit